MSLSLRVNKLSPVSQNFYMSTMLKKPKIGNQRHVFKSRLSATATTLQGSTCVTTVGQTLMAATEGRVSQRKYNRSYF